MIHDSSTNQPALRPNVRLGLTLGLGILGALLLRAQKDFAPHIFGNVKGINPVIWITALLVAVLLLHRVENVKTPKSVKVLGAWIWLLSLLFVFGFGSAWLGLLLLLLVMGIAFSKLSTQGDSVRQLGKNLVRGVAIMLAGPLLLFSSRPVAVGGTDSRRQVFWKVLFAVFPHLMATGLVLPSLLGLFHYHNLASSVGLIGLTFTTWAWLGGALIMLMSPWPQDSLVFRVGDLTTAQKQGNLITIAFVAAMLIHLALIKRIGLFLAFFHPLFIWGGIGCVLFIFIHPWPQYPRLPKLTELPESHKVWPISTFIFLLLVLAPVAIFAYGPFLAIVSGKLFCSLTFDTIHAGFALDQPTIGKWFFLFIYFSAQVFSCVTAARWGCRRNTRWGYWAFFIPTSLLCLCLWSILTLPYWWLIQYIYSMGMTSMRLDGLTYGIFGYLTVGFFWCWAIWPPKKEKLMR